MPFGKVTAAKLPLPSSRSRVATGMPSQGSLPVTVNVTTSVEAAVDATSAVSMPASKAKRAVAAVLKDEGYIVDFRDEEGADKPTLTIELKYFEGRPVIETIERVSRPGLRVFRGKDDLPKVMGGLGVATYRPREA